jgi:hypothetical protein
MNKKNYQKKILLFIITFLIFTSPHIIRWFYYENPSIIGFPTHFHLRIAQDILDGNFNNYDNLSFEGRQYTYPPLFVYLLAAAGLFGSLKITTMLLMALIGAVSIILLYKLIEEFCGERKIFFAFILFTPGIIYLFSHLSSRSPPIMLGLAAIYLFRKYPLVAMVLLGLSFWFHPETGIIFLLSLVILRHVPLKFIAIPFIIAGLYFVPFIATHGLPEYNLLHEEYREMRYSLETPSINSYIWELGENGYFSIPIILLMFGGLGAGKFLRNKRLMLWLLVIFALTLVAERLIIYLIFPVLFIACSGWNKIHRHKLLTIILIIYIVAIGAWRIDAFARAYPEQHQYNAMVWIKQNTPEDALVFSDWIWGHWISGIAQRANYIDGYAEYAPDVNERLTLLDDFYENCTVPENADYIYMEWWRLDEKNTTCDYEIVFSEKQSLVLRK